MDIFGNLIQFGMLVLTAVGMLVSGAIYVESTKVKMMRETNAVLKDADDNLRRHQDETAKSYEVLRNTFWERTDRLDDKLCQSIQTSARDEQESRNKLRTEFGTMMNKLESKLDKIIDSQGVIASLSEAVSNLKNEINRRKD